MTKSGTVAGKVCFDLGSVKFPEEEWSDFVVVVLGWWLEEVLKLADRAEGRSELLFMEGTFFVRVANDDSTGWLLECMDGKQQIPEFVKSIDRDIFMKSLLLAASQTIDSCRENEWLDSALDRLVSLREQMQNHLSSRS